MSKILGIDYGDRRVGLAIGDLETKTAVPYRIIDSTDEAALINELDKIIERENIDKVVLGLPLSLSGHEIREQDNANTQMQKVLAFKDLIVSKLEVEIITEDERLSTRMARNLGGRSSKERCDDVAAMLILQSYLDRYTDTQ